MAFDSTPSEVNALKMGNEGVKAALKSIKGGRVPRRIDTGVTDEVRNL